PADQRVAIAEHLVALLENCNSYNRDQVLRFLHQQKPLFRHLGPENFPAHFALYTIVMNQWPRNGYSILCNLMEATMAGTVPIDIAHSRAAILQFIARTHGFNATHYKAYLRRGDAFLEELNQYAKDILLEGLGAQEIKGLIQSYDRHDTVIQGVASSLEGYYP